MPVLVVDDEASFLASVAEGLSSGDAPYDVLTAEDGEKAIEVLTRNDVALVMTDLKMPRCDGFTLLTWLATHRPAIPVIVMTAFGTPGMEDRVIDGGAIHFIDKPFDVSAARRAIANILSQAVAAIALPDLLRLISLERTTGVLSMSLGARDASVAVHNGQLIAVRFGELFDREAALAMRNRPVDWFALEMRDGKTVEQLRAALGAHGPLAQPLHLKDFVGAADASVGNKASTPISAARETDLPIGELLAQISDNAGVVGAAIIDVERNAVLGAQRVEPSFDSEQAALGYAEILRLERRLAQSVPQAGEVEEIIATLGGQYHLLRACTQQPRLALYLALNRERGSFALARLRLADIDGGIK